MAGPDRSEELNSNVQNGSCSSNEGTNQDHVMENVVKVRKPYTVTKQREKWSEEEHERFIEAIKLYGRGWRQIEEHVGTKTAVQIRSHAQKFFNKVGREAVVIPPPRLKRRPSHPYPRKLPVPYSQTPSSNLSVMEKGTKSPTSVLSTFASEDQINRCSSPNSCTSDIQSVSGKNDYATSKQSLTEGAVIGSSAPISSITLFGKLVIVAESQKQSSNRDDEIDLKPMTDEENHCSWINNCTLHIGSRHVDTNLTLGVWETSCAGSNAFDTNEKYTEPLNSPWKRLSSLEKEEPCYPANRFRPYKRCLSKREVTSLLSLVTSEEQKSRRRARVCL